MTYAGQPDARSLLAPWRLNPDNFAGVSVLADVENLVGGNSAVRVFLSTQGETGFSWDEWVAATATAHLDPDVVVSQTTMPLPDGRSLLEAGASDAEFHTLPDRAGTQTTAARLTDGIVIQVNGLNNAAVESMLSLPPGTIRTLCPHRERKYRITFQ